MARRIELTKTLAHKPRKIHHYAPDEGGAWFRRHKADCGQDVRARRVVPMKTSADWREVDCAICINSRDAVIAERERAETRETERDFQRSVTDMLEAAGFRWYHSADSRRDRAGFPDIVATDGSRILFAELKSEDGEVSPAQKGWLNDLWLVSERARRESRGGASLFPAVDVRTWRPSQLDEIQDWVEMNAKKEVSNDD